ncbi:hypothetical protein [Bradyrhizobium sp. Arg816]|uniref:hypothetical protein n=1 Tax=Bradyrhizobium sp. Arg816 TaxID=2998491 RepID=UPI00249DA780|nr:hypothetical protein [Bradyrhizobium sp. Arg816]MDI3563397.1 hypothetical protein [Bradyrhizobium sp. Arg816]
MPEADTIFRVNYQPYQLIKKTDTWHASGSVNAVKKVDLKISSRKMKMLGTIVLMVLAAKVAGLAARLCERRGSDIGINRGGGRRCWDLVNAGDVVRASPPPMRCLGATGGPLGGEIGFRWQMANSMFGIPVNGKCANPRTPTLISFCRASG